MDPGNGGVGAVLAGRLLATVFVRTAAEDERCFVRHGDEEGED